MDGQRNAPAGADWLNIAGKVCVVTGAAGGIGAEISRQLATAGAKLALLDRDEKAIEDTRRKISDTGATVIALTCDVTDAASVAAAADTVARELGCCDVLVNNAATIYAAALMQVDIERWNQLMAVNVGGYLLCSQAFGRQMIEAGGGGSIIHVSSLSGQYPQAFSGPYSVSKAGVNMLSRLLTAELGEHGIRSNVVSPAMILTPLSEVIYADPEVRRQREKIVPASRISEPGDIAQAVLFLASERSSYINGQDILVDGGLSQVFLGLIPRPGFEKQDAR